MSVAVLPWLEYRWSFDFPVGMFAAIRERLRGTPARLDELMAGVPAEVAVRRLAVGKWSAQEHAGHLTVVERLWQVRLVEYLQGAEALTAADMENRVTAGEGFNDRPLEEILLRFRQVRAATVRSLDGLALDDAARVAHHPRLGVMMRLVDLCFFAAEHDDHHLAAIHDLIHGE